MINDRTPIDEIRIALMVWGGAEHLGVWNYYINMARILRRYEPRYRVVMFCPVGLSAEKREEAASATGEAPRELPPKRLIDDMLALTGWWDRDFARRFTEAKIDVVFEQAKFLGRDFPIPTLAWIGDLQHRHLPQYFSRRHRLTRDLGFRAQVQMRNHVLVSSQSARYDLLEMVQRPNAQIHVVPFAVIGDVVEQTAVANVLARHHLSKAPFLFMPNQLWQHKNHITGFQAIAELVRRGRPITLAISGPAHDYRNPTYSDELARQSEALGIAQHLRWLGTIPHTDLLSLMAGASAVLNPSLFEGWSTTVEEAKCRATRLILSDLDVHREQASGYATFFSRRDPIALADAIEATLAEPLDDRTSMRAAALARNICDQKIYANRLVEALDAAISSHHGRKRGKRVTQTTILNQTNVTSQ